MLELWLKTQDLKHHTCVWLHRSLLYLSLKRLSVNHDAYSVNAGTKGMGMTSKCDLFWEEGGRAGETNRKKETAGRRKEEWEGDWRQGGGEEGFGPQVTGLLSFLDRPLSLLVKKTLLFSEEYSLQDFFFLFSQSCTQMMVSTLRALTKKTKKQISPLHFCFTSITCREGVALPRYVLEQVCLTTASACVCVSGFVCVFHIIYKLIYKLLGMYCMFVIYKCVSKCMCVHVLLFCAWCVYVCVCVWVCVFSLGNRQVPLQSQTAGCSPQSLTPWYPAEEDVPPVACWSPGLSCQIPYDTAK